MKTIQFFIWLFFVTPLLGQITLLEETPNSVDLKITTTPPTIQLGNGVSHIYFEGWETGGNTGDYEMPLERTLVSLPARAIGQIKIIALRKSKKIKLPFRLALVQAHGERNINRSTRGFNSRYFEIESQGHSEGDNVLVLLSRPVHYFDKLQAVEYVEEAHIRVEFKEKGLVNSEPVTGKSGQVVKWLSINPPKENKTSSGTKLDLVIAHKSYQSALKDYLDNKKALGRELKEYYVENATTQSIKKIIDDEYKGTRPPDTTLLVGSISQIPSYKDNESTWTDYKYTLVGPDTLPDVALGRIPAQTEEELKNVLSKILAREKEVLKYSDVLLTAGKDTSMGCPANVTKVGQKLKANYSEANLIKKYRTEVSTDAVISAYNAEPNVLFYDGHGNRTSMSEVPLSISTLNQLINRKNYLIFDIACLNANWNSSGPQSRNFAESILLRKDSGAAGILASGGSGWGHEFFQTIGELMGKARSAAVVDPDLNQVGRVILLAKIKHGSQDRTFWNYYGDPATSVWESSWGK